MSRRKTTHQKRKKKSPYNFADPKYGVTKGSARYDPEEWDRYEQLCARRGISATTQIRCLVRAFTDGQLVELGDLLPASLSKVQRHADEVGLELRTVVVQIIADWLAARAQQDLAAA